MGQPVLRDVNGTFFAERLIDLSLGGLRLATAIPLAVGSTQRLKLSAHGQAPVHELEVVSVTQGQQPGELHAGLRFVQPERARPVVEEVLRAALTMPSQLRAGPRLAVDVEAFWSGVGSKTTGRLQLLNLGVGGALIRGEGVPAPGTPLIIGVYPEAASEMSALPARVVWSRRAGDGQLAGVAFSSDESTRALTRELLELYLCSPPPAVEAAPLVAAGTRQGHFEFGELLSRGRSLEVYRARAFEADGSQAADVALVRFSGSEPALSAWNGRFLAAAELGAQLLQVPGVLRTFVATSSRSEALLVTELLEDSTSLERVLAPFTAKASPIPLVGSLEVMRQVLETLDQCHAHGPNFVHGDLRPSNVLVSRDGEVKLTGFGRAPAELVAGEHRPSPDRLHSMAPELFRDGGSATPATDVYQAGVLLYEALTGAPPFRPTSPEHLLKLVAAGPLAPSKFNPRVSTLLDLLCSQALSLHASARPTMAQFATRVRELLVFARSTAETTDPAGSLSRVVERSGRNRAHPVTPVDDSTDIATRIPSLSFRPRKSELEMGMVLGRYRILGKVAQGGMAVVYLARPSDGDAQPLVLKTLLPSQHADVKSLMLFLNEARVAVLLNHPNIVQLHDFGIDQGTPYMALEYVEGRTLAQVLTALTRQRRRLDPSLAAALLRECCRGLGYAHALETRGGDALNIVHRDLSARNILISYSGDVKVLDFGIAKFRGARDVTERGMVRGTVDYVAPEQLSEKPVTRAVDIWALGINLYEMLTGRRPFSKGDFVRNVSAIAHEPHVPASQLVTSCPRELSDIVDRALQKNVEARYPDMGAMVTDLDAWLERHPAPAGGLVTLMGALFPEGPNTDRERLARLAWGQDDVSDELDVDERASSQPASERLTDPPRGGSERVTEPPVRRTEELPEPVQTADLIFSNTAALRTDSRTDQVPPHEAEFRDTTKREPALRPGAVDFLGPDAPTTVVSPQQASRRFPVVPVALGVAALVGVVALALGVSLRGDDGLAAMRFDAGVARAARDAGVVVAVAVVAPDSGVAGVEASPRDPGPGLPSDVGSRVEARSEVVDAGRDAGTTLALRSEVVDAGQAPARDAGPTLAVQVVDAGQGGPRLQLACNLGCAVSVDGTPRGAPPLEVEVTPGAHTVSFVTRSRFGTASKTMEVTVRADDNRRKVAATFGVGTLTVTAPAKSAVFLFGKRVGFTPLKGLKVVEGVHEIAVVRSGAGTAKYKVTISGGKATSLSAK